LVYSRNPCDQAIHLAADAGWIASRSLSSGGAPTRWLAMMEKRLV